MSKIIDESISIYYALQNIKEGKYVMPAFQRQYVWGMEQIEKLWDSILLDYPIATFLFWHIDESNVTEDTYFCNFLGEVTFNSRKCADSTSYELTSIDLNKTSIAILDGQQRLTSLFLSLLGEAYIRPNYARKRSGNKISAKLFIELNKNKLTLDEGEYNSKKFDIKFTEKSFKVSQTQFEIKNILKEEFRDRKTREKAIEEFILKVPKESKEYAKNILNKLCNKVFEEKLIRYTKIEDMKQEDALEMFVRFNSGGKALRKAEITMSILEAYWPSAKREFGHVLVNCYEGFGTDFIIRLSLMLYGDVLKSSINKKIAEELKNNWEDLKKALENLEELLKDMKIDIRNFSNSWNVLLPIIYCIYYNPDYKNNIKGIRAYLFRAIFFRYFKAGTTGKLKQIVGAIREFDYEINIDMLDEIKDLRVTEAKIEEVINSEKGSRVSLEVLYYFNLNWMNKNLKYEQDHLHPYSRFDESKPLSVSMEDWKRWRGMRNRLPNLQLLEGRSNGSKSNMALIDYYNDMNKEQKAKFIKDSIIPEGVSLEIKDFEIFYEKRKELLTEKLRDLLF